MVDFKALGGLAQDMLSQASHQGQGQNQHQGGNSDAQWPSSGSPPPGNQGRNDDVRAAVSANLSSLLSGGGAQQQEGTQSRGLGSFISGLGSLGDLDERKVNAAHERAYAQGQAGDMSSQDVGAAAGKEVFDMIFSRGSSNSSSGPGTRSVGASGGQRVPDANDVSTLFGEAAAGGTEVQAATGRTDRGFLDQVVGAATQAGKPPRQKDTMEKIIDLISREVAKLMGSGNGNQNDVAAAATQTFTQLMIKKKIYAFMGKQAPEDSPADQVTGFLGTLNLGGKPQQQSGGGGGGLGGLASQFLGGGSGQQQQQQSSQSSQAGGFGALAGLAASALGGGSKPQQQQQQQQGTYGSQQGGYGGQQQQQSPQSSQAGGFGALASLAASALGGGSKPQQQGSYGNQQQGNYGNQQQGNYGNQQQGSYGNQQSSYSNQQGNYGSQLQGTQQSQQQGGGGPDISQLINMAGPMLSALGGKK